MTSGYTVSVKPFNLLRWFSLLSLAVIAAISIMSAILLSRFLREQLMQVDASITMEFVQSTVESHDAAAYFAGTDAGRDEQALNDFFRRIEQMQDVVRANAYSLERKLVWSSTKKLIGRTFTKNPELDEALAGHLATERGRVKDRRKAEHIMFDASVSHFVEYYLPVRDPHDDRVVGVAEVYKIPRVLNLTIERANRLVWVSALIGGLVLYVTLFWIVQRAGRVMRDQHQALLKAERLAVVGEMASSIAHSIRNPIASIRSSAELAQEESGEGAKDYLEDIVREVDHFDSWIRDLLSFSHSPCDPDQTASLPDVVGVSLYDLKQRLSRQAIETVLDLPASLPAVRSDAQLLRQVLNSVITNAVEAMPQGGRLTVEARQQRRAVRVKVIDTGTGLSPERLKDVFIPLVSYKRGGLGIGLALARQIVGRYGGSLELQSTEGVGTTAVIDLPAAR
jgi:signal transduction histidine kinase